MKAISCFLNRFIYLFVPSLESLFKTEVIMVRNLGVWLLLTSFLISIFPLKNVISSRSTFSDENVSDDAFLCPFLGDQKSKRKKECLGCEHSIPAQDAFRFYLQSFVNFAIYS